MTADTTGAPCWFSLTTRDLPAAEAFYGGVLGWTFREAGPGRDVSVAESDGVPVAALCAVSDGFAVSVAWRAYFAVDDADAAVTRIRSRGGTVGVGPVAGSPYGRAALATDADGASFGIAEGDALSGWRSGGKATAWLELHTRDAFDAALFYGGVLGWAGEADTCCEVSYEREQVVLRHDGQAVARLDSGPVDGASPRPQLRPRWEVHFRVPDLDAAEALVLEHGGTVLSDAFRPGHGRRITVRDPEGGLFTLDEAQPARPSEPLTAAALSAEIPCFREDVLAAS